MKAYGINATGAIQGHYLAFTLYADNALGDALDEVMNEYWNSGEGSRNVHTLEGMNAYIRKALPEASAFIVKEIASITPWDEGEVLIQLIYPLWPSREAPMMLPAIELQEGD